MKDFLDKDLQVDDRVVGLYHSRTSSSLFLGRVVGFTGTMVRVYAKRKGDYEHNTFLISSEKLVKA